MSTLRANLVDVWLGDGSRGVTRGLRALGRRIRRAPRTIRYYHRVDDPRSWLLAKVLGPFVDAYGLALEIVIVPTPSADVDPEPELRAKFDVEDTRRLARAFGLAFPEPGLEPVAARVRMANAVALLERPVRERLELLAQVSELLLGRAGDALATLADERGAFKGQDVRAALERGYASLRKRGFYTSAAVEYEGEFYPGVERLAHLEERLVAEGLPDAGLAPRLPVPEPKANLGALVDVEVFFSFRSPYSYVGVERIAALAESHGLRLVLRPVLPMVMRGLAVPRQKRLYIVRDAKREARRYDIPFGKIVDPVGAGAERCLAVACLAAHEGKDLAFSLAALRAIWSRGVDVATDAGLREVAAEAGLDAAFVDRALADVRWKDVVEKNRETMYELEAWGVPTFRIGELVTWGQDRLPLVLDAAERLRGR